MEGHASGHPGVAQRDDNVRHDEFGEDAEEPAPDQNTSREKSKLQCCEREDSAPDEAHDQMQQAAGERDTDSGAKRGRAEKVGGVPLEEDESSGLVHEENFGDPEEEVNEDRAGDSGAEMMRS